MKQQKFILRVEVTRGSEVESVHEVIYAVARASGEIVQGAGDIHRRVYPRSAMKPIQALSSLESGAFEAFELGPEEVALHCASHSGEITHIEAIRCWLAKIGLDESHLECGPQAPLWAIRDPTRMHASPPPRPISNNCSGKHAGFLTTALHLGGPTKGYVDAAHPVQQRVSALLAELAGEDQADFAVATDMCRAPIYALPLKSFALSLARFADPSCWPEGRQAAIKQVITSMRRHPMLVAGTGRIDTVLMSHQAFQGVAKCGAEGVFAMILPEQDLGIALKVVDGADRAAGVAAIAILEHLGVLDKASIDELHSIARPQIRNWSDETVGQIRATCC